jgi:hypothetical protein
MSSQMVPRTASELASDGLPTGPKPLIVASDAGRSRRANYP